MCAVGKNIPHDSAKGHVTGQSVYIDDVPFTQRELIVDFLGSPIARGHLKSIDLTEAAKIPGIAGLFTAKDLPGKNLFGPILQDEVLLVEDHCTFIGEPIVVIAAENRQAIELAKKAIKLEIEEHRPNLTVDDCIANNEYIDRTYSIQRGDVQAAFAKAKHIIEGVFVIGGQDHFYLESQAAIVVPGEHGQLTVHSSTQNPSEVQSVIATLLGLQFGQVVCVAKRMGGGFGGKECQATHPAAMAALVALKLKRTARIVYNKDDDMMYTGKRHPFQNNYKVSFDDDGEITALQAHLYADGGAANDLSTAVLGRAMTHVDNAYYLPNADIVGKICRTNYPPNTAFRGFGGPQGCATIENIMEEIAAYLHKDPFDIRRRNCYGIDDRNVTHYGQTVKNNTLPRLFDELAKSCDYKRRYKEIQEFNAKSKTHLKGIAITAVKFGISFTNKFLNQGNALVNVYLDGSVQVSTGATEMGQGVNTNIKQLVAEEFAIDHTTVLVMATSTEKNNNTSPTAASAATDLNGSAAVDACRKIKEGISKVAADHFAAKEPGLGADPQRIVFEDGFVFDKSRPKNKVSFKDMVGMAYRERVSLGERGHYATPGIHFDWNVGQGSPFLYFTCGVCCAEVLIDRFTGDLKVTRLDALMDVGKAINPGINKGQITGGIIQGMGWTTTEELRFDAKGHLLSHSPTTYKIPNIQDVPEIFNVNVIDNDNTVNIRGTKAVGEPPLVLGLAPWAAVKHALSFVSKNEIPKLALPATNEQILSRLSYYAASDGTNGHESGKDVRFWQKYPSKNTTKNGDTKGDAKEDAKGNMNKDSTVAEVSP